MIVSGVFSIGTRVVFTCAMVCVMKMMRVCASDSAISIMKCCDVLFFLVTKDMYKEIKIRKSVSMSYTDTISWSGL